jgi:hypothetical protein
MTRMGRLAWAFSVLAPLAGWALLLWLGGYVVLTTLGGVPLGGKGFAWLSALLVLLWLAGHMIVRLHGWRGRGFARDSTAELAFELRHGRGPSHWRDAMSRRGQGSYSGRSHSGEKPRFD